MAAFTTNIHARRTQRPSFFARFDAFFTSVAHARACSAQYQSLAGLTDAQLAARGLKRADIVRHVARAYL